MCNNSHNRPSKKLSLIAFALFLGYASLFQPTIGIEKSPIVAEENSEPHFANWYSKNMFRVPIEPAFNRKGSTAYSTLNYPLVISH